MSKYSKNEILVYEDYCKVILRDKKGRATGQAIIDREDYYKVAKHNWSKTNSGYAIAHNPDTKRDVLMHSLLLGTKDGLVIDHINMNRLDNRKKNLRHVTRSMNAFNTITNTNNTSGVRGVYWVKATKRWIARITKDNRIYYLGSSKDFIEAVKIRQEKEVELLGKVVG